MAVILRFEAVVGITLAGDVRARCSDSDSLQSLPAKGLSRL
jgi:hypothetical protein